MDTNLDPNVIPDPIQNGAQDVFTRQAPSNPSSHTDSHVNSIPWGRYASAALSALLPLVAQLLANHVPAIRNIVNKVGDPSQHDSL
jgi:hypothetical protein